jgi:putative ATP-dependent endonuclease of OLD family
MFIERLILTNFRCFGPEPGAIELASGLTAFVGVNGAGKTAVMQALQRLFGVTGD